MSDTTQTTPNITSRWVTVKAIPPRISPELRQAIDYLTQMAVGEIAHIDADSASIAKRAAKHITTDEPSIKFATKADTDPSNAGFIYIHKISG